VYETVRLPADRFDEFGSIRIPSRDEAKIENDYFYEWDAATIKYGNPDILKDSFRVVRMSDGKTLGTAISYARRGGDFPLSPSHPSSFSCPPDSGLVAMKKQLFIQ